MTEGPKPEQPKDMWEEDSAAPKAGALFPELANMPPEALETPRNTPDIPEIAEGRFGIPEDSEIGLDQSQPTAAAPNQRPARRSVVPFQDLRKATTLGPNGIRATLRVLDSYNNNHEN